MRTAPGFPPSYSDPEFYRRLRTRLHQRISTWRPYRYFGYCLGDETSYVGDPTGRTPIDFDFCPHALDEFRRWLRREYGTLDALNEEWNASYGTWEKVVPYTLDEARANRSYPPWADHRTFAEASTDRMYAFVKDCVRQIDPEARIMTSAPKFPRAYSGLDYSTITTKFDSLVSSNISGLLEIQRSFMPGPKTVWVGYGSPAVEVRSHAWRAFMQGYGLSFYTQRCGLHPDYSFLGDAKACVDVGRALQSGLGRLLWGSARQSQVAMHYSQASIHGVWLEDAGERFLENLRGWTTAIEDMGYQPEFLSARDIADGRLDRFKLLVLPYSVAISRAEADAVEAYVKNGGVVIADCRAGLTNEHCNPAKGQKLRELFGVRHGNAGAEPYEMAGGEIVFGQDYRNTVTVAGKRIYAGSGESGLQVAGGTALARMGDTPVYVISKYGKGHTVYLNFFMSGYLNARKRGAESALRDSVHEAFKLAGMRPPLDIADAEGRKVPAVEVCQYGSGGNSYFVVLKSALIQDRAVARVKVSFPDERHLYDPIQGTYLGRVKRAATVLSPGDGRVFAQMGYRVRGVNVGAEHEDPAPGRVASFRAAVETDGGRPGFHVLRMQVYGPGGAPRKHYSRNLPARNGQATAHVPLALNEERGTWRVQIRDTATGCKAEAEFTVR